MPDLSYVNPNIHQIKNQEISIQVSPDGFSFCIRSSSDKTCLLFRQYKFNNILLIDELIRKTESILSGENYLNSGFEKVEVTFISQNSAIIPSEFFNKENLKKYFEFSHNLAELDELHFTQLPLIEAYNVFSIPGYFSQLFYSAFPNVVFNHQATRLINYGYQNQLKEPVIIIGLNSGFFDLVVFENNKLILSNSFQYTNATDLIYFFLYACKQLKIQIEKTNVVVFGEATSNHQLIEEIAAQVYEVIIPDLKNISTCKNFSQNQAAQFYNHFITF